MRCPLDGREQRGAALLAAMLTVTLVATLAAAAMWQQWRSVAVEAAERSRQQSAWLLVGAQDFSRLILREDARGSSSDHLGEPWAVPLQEARLSSFLTQGEADLDREAFLSGQMVDLQSRLNVYNLLDGQKLSLPHYQMFERLFAQLGLPGVELQRLATNYLAASDPVAAYADGAQVPLQPQRVDQLVWLGLSPVTLAALKPHITLVPAQTPVNLNTADAQVLQASVQDMDRATAERLVAERANAPFKTLAEAGRLLGPLAESITQGRHSIASRFFEVSGSVRVEDSLVQERAIIQRDGQRVRTLWRERAALPPPTIAAALATGNARPSPSR